MPPTDKGLPGKTTFRIGFIAPIHPDLAGLSQLGKEFESAFRVAVEMMNKDLSLSVDFDVKIQGSGVDPGKSCKLAADELANDNVVAVVGAYRSSCSVAAANVLGKLSQLELSHSEMFPVLLQFQEKYLHTFQMKEKYC